jgi:hypothetical protein
VEEKLNTVIENIDAIMNKNNARFDNINSEFDNIINGLQNMMNNDEANKNEGNNHMNELMQLIRKCLYDNKDIIEQGKSLIFGLLKDISDKIDNVQGYMLNSIQALREQISNNHGV